MRRALSDLDRTVRVPVHVLDAMFSLVRADQAHAVRTGSRLSDEEAMAKLGIGRKKLEAAKKARGRPVLSLDSSPDGPDGPSLINTFEAPGGATLPMDVVATRQLGEDLRKLMRFLTRQEADILSRRFGLDGADPLTLQQIADKYGLSRERIRQLEARALKKLKARSDRLREHLG
jgi:RNA polymerase primary sigma factor